METNPGVKPISLQFNLETFIAVKVSHVIVKIWAARSISSGTEPELEYRGINAKTGFSAKEHRYGNVQLITDNAQSKKMKFVPRGEASFDLPRGIVWLPEISIRIIV